MGAVFFIAPAKVCFWIGKRIVTRHGIFSRITTFMLQTKKDLTYISVIRYNIKGKVCKKIKHNIF